MANLVQPPTPVEVALPPPPTPSHVALPWWRGWPPLAALPALVMFMTPATWPAWAFMWTFAVAIYGGCKWLTWRRTSTPGASPWRQLGYLLAWPGMDAAAFLNPRSTAPAPPATEWLFACCKFAAGLAILFVAANSPPAVNALWFAWAGMVGIVMLLHFGAFHILSCAWRSGGVNARPLMNWPAASVSLSEFWGRRWNTAFRDLTYRFLFRPLTARLGPRTALVVGFLVSGLIHDAVISFPARGGYGGPTLYYAFQALGLLAERSRPGRKVGLGAGRRGWLFTMAVLIGPVPLLFHRPFLASIIIPFLHALGTLS